MPSQKNLSKQNLSKIWRIWATAKKSKVNVRQEVQSQQEAQSQEFVSKANIGLEWRHRDIKGKK